MCAVGIVVAGSGLETEGMFGYLHFKGVITTKKREEYRDQWIEITDQTQISKERVSIYR